MKFTSLDVKFHENVYIRTKGKQKLNKDKTVWKFFHYRFLEQSTLLLTFPSTYSSIYYLYQITLEEDNRTGKEYK